MQVAFHLQRRSESAPASALLLTSHEPADLLRLCARFGHDPLPPIFAVADGFLLKLPRPYAAAVAGVIRLRSLADNLLLPVDADLVPALLPDEAGALVRQRGLIFLPGGRALEFDPARPVALSALLGVSALRRETWQPLPAPEPLAARLLEISLDRPEPPPELILEEGGEDVATEEPRPEDSNLPSRALGKATFGLGKGLAWLGQTLGLKGLSAAGAKWMAAALSMAPRLSESVLGRQEASLRDLLRDFREGKIERALRRALPMGDEGRGSAPAGDARLPTHNLFYSLGNILGGSDGPGALWFGNFDVYQELAKEYRKQAELAAQRGDYRRAAFIYGKLLRDYRSAAGVLSRGGLHRDAAILYLKKLDDRLAAAREYEAAGEIDRALRLYRQQGEHALAGDLLRRAGEDELAVAEYRLAAERLILAGQGQYQAGELMRSRAGREDLALPYYEAGWSQRPAGTPVPCALRIAQVYTSTGAVDRLLALTAEAADFLSAPGQEGPAGEFYNEVARLAERVPEPQARDDLHDRALTGIAGKIRQRAEQATEAALVSRMFGSSQVWAPAVVSDAQFAVKHAGRRPVPAVPASVTTTVIRARIARVTGVCQAPHSGDVFLGFESGEVVCFRPLFGEAATLTDEQAPVVSLATTEDGNTLVVLSGRGLRGRALRSYSRTVGYHMVGAQVVETEESPWLCPQLVDCGGSPVVGFWGGKGMLLLQASSLIFTGRWELPQGDVEPDAGMLLVGSGGLAGIALLAAEGFQVLFGREDNLYLKTPSWKHLGWRPHSPPGGTLRRPALAWLFKGAGKMELTGIGPDGHLHVSAVHFSLDGENVAVTTKAHAPAGPLLAAAILRPGLYAAVTPSAVEWVRRESAGLRLLRSTPVSLPGAVACFHHARGKELIVVCRDGTVARLPVACS